MITSGLCVSAKLDFLKGVHQPGDQYKMALYTAAANLSPLSTTAYTSAGEVQTKGYQAGGMPLTGIEYVTAGTSAVMGWSYDPQWKNVSIKAKGAMIYNASKDNKALVVVEFPNEIISTNGNFRVEMPPVTGTEAPIWID